MKLSCGESAAGESAGDADVGMERELDVRDLLALRPSQWVVTDSRSDQYMQFETETGVHVINVSVVEAHDVRYCLSYRWDKMEYCKRHKVSFCPSFIKYCMAQDKQLWVDFINHLDNKIMKQKVVSGMGQLYADCVSWPMYLDPKVDLAMYKRFEAACRGWMWQELCVGRVYAHTNLTPQLIRRLRAIYQQDINNEDDEHLETAVSRARTCGDETDTSEWFQPAIRLFGEHCNTIIESPSLEVARKSILGALSNMQSQAYSFRTDNFVASFSSLTSKWMKGADSMTMSGLATFISDMLGARLAILNPLKGVDYNALKIQKMMVLLQQVIPGTAKTQYSGRTSLPGFAHLEPCHVYLIQPAIMKATAHIVFTTDIPDDNGWFCVVIFSDKYDVQNENTFSSSGNLDMTFEIQFKENCCGLTASECVTVHCNGVDPLEEGHSPFREDSSDDCTDLAPPDVKLSCGASAAGESAP